MFVFGGFGFVCSAGLVVVFDGFGVCVRRDGCLCSACLVLAFGELGRSENIHVYTYKRIRVSTFNRIRVYEYKNIRI